jgi:hypothetical protein
LPRYAIRSIGYQEELTQGDVARLVVKGYSLKAYFERPVWFPLIKVRESTYFPKDKLCRICRVVLSDWFYRWNVLVNNNFSFLKNKEKNCVEAS